MKRRNLLQVAGLSTITGLSGCSSIIGKQQFEGEFRWISINDQIIRITKEQGSFEDIIVELYTTPYLAPENTDNKTVVTTYDGSEFTQTDDDTFEKQIDIEAIQSHIPVREPTSIRSRIKRKDEETVIDSEKAFGMGIGQRNEYYLLKYRDGTVKSQIPVWENYTTDRDEKQAYYNTWETEDKIHYDLAFFISEEILSLELGDVNPKIYEFQIDSEKGKKLPFIFKFEVPKSEKQGVEELTDNPRPEITWTDFKKTMYNPKVGEHKYYERPIFKTIANQITDQLTYYEDNANLTFQPYADLRVLRAMWEIYISYDFGTIEDDTSDVIYPSQAFLQKDADCEGTSFNIASIAYQLGYNVSIQGLQKQDENYLYHVQPAVELEMRDVFDEKKRYRYPDRVRDHVPQKAEDHVNIHPGIPIGFSEGGTTIGDEAKWDNPSECIAITYLSQE